MRICVCRHYEEQGDEAIQSSFARPMDCFAEPVIGRAHLRDPLARNDGEARLARLSAM
jgi:hypothetical protein